MTETDGVRTVTTVEEVLRGGSGGTDGKVLTSTSISTSSSSGTSSGSSAGRSSSSSSSSSGTATGGEDAYGEETSPENYADYGDYYWESTVAPDGDTSRRVTITSIGTGSELDLGAAGKIDLGAGTGIERSVISREAGTSKIISSNETSVG